jgi:hypothetical protein
MNLGAILTSFCPKDHSSAMVEDEMESFMQIWQASSVALQPELSLSPWQIFETASGSRHFFSASTYETEPVESVRPYVNSILLRLKASRTPGVCINYEDHLATVKIPKTF